MGYIAAESRSYDNIAPNRTFALCSGTQQVRFNFAFGYET
jgi:hypothetical protein